MFKLHVPLIQEVPLYLPNKSSVKPNTYTALRTLLLQTKGHGILILKSGEAHRRKVRGDFLKTTPKGAGPRSHGEGGRGHMTGRSSSSNDQKVKDNSCSDDEKGGRDPQPHTTSDWIRHDDEEKEVDGPSLSKARRAAKIKYNYNTKRPMTGLTPPAAAWSSRRRRRR